MNNDMFNPSDVNGKASDVQRQGSVVMELAEQELYKNLDVQSNSNPIKVSELSQYINVQKGQEDGLMHEFKVGCGCTVIIDAYILDVIT